MINMNNDYFFVKILLVGEWGTGKSALAQRYGNNEFSENYDTTLGVDFVNKMVRLQEGQQVIKLSVFDTAGQIRYRSIIEQYFRGTAGIMIACDRTCRESFNGLSHWIELAKQTAKDMPIVIAQTKTDKYVDEENMDVSLKELQQFCQEHGCDLVATSARTGEGVNAAFELLLGHVLRNIDSKGEATQHIMLQSSRDSLDLRPIRSENCCTIL